MTDSFEPIDPDLGISRRALLRRGAIVAGTVAWAAPVVQSFTSPAAGTTGSPVPGPGNISYVAVLVRCGTACFVAKYEVGVGLDGCGDQERVNTPCCTDFSAAELGGCILSTPPDCGSLVANGDGSVTYSAPRGCIVTSYRIHCGQCCDGPGAAGQPLPGVSTIILNSCSGVGNANFPCSVGGAQFESCSAIKHPRIAHQG
ncbi:MAG: hypothetical protein ACRDHY_20000 [Anaerolineales bacterium]